MALFQQRASVNATANLTPFTGIKNPIKIFQMCWGKKRERRDGAAVTAEIGINCVVSGQQFPHMKKLLPSQERESSIEHVESY